jgi:hypothetical protein
MHATRTRLAILFIATLIGATGPSDARPPERLVAAPAELEREPISAWVALGCQPGDGFVARVVAQARERSTSRFALGMGFVAIYRDGSWIHVAEFVQPCIVASGRRADMLTYFAIE